jgi:excisionase family DNA binding protein
MEPGAPALLTFDEAGFAMGCSGRTVRRLVAHGQLDRVMVGSRPRVPRASVDRYIVEHMERPTPHAVARVAELRAQGRL